MYHTVLNITWKGRVSNKEVLERMGLKMHLLSFIAKRKAAFFRHICRGSSGNDTVTVLEGSVDGMRS